MTLASLADHGTIYLLAHAFASSAAFQTVTDSDTVTEALTRVHYPEANFEQTDDGVVMYVDLLPPRIVIADALGEYELSEGGIHSFRTPAETFFCSFDFYIPDEYACEGPKNSWAWFRTKVLTIIKEVRALGKTGDVDGLGAAYPTIDMARRLEGPYRMDVAERELHDDIESPLEGSQPELWHTAFELVRGV